MLFIKVEEIESHDKIKNSQIFVYIFVQQNKIKIHRQISHRNIHQYCAIVQQSERVLSVNNCWKIKF